MGHTIVHVDDDPTILRLVALAFEKAGHQIVSMTDAERAERKIRELKPHLLICDISMPFMDGFELVAKLRTGDGAVNAPVIFFSAVGGDDVVLRAFEMGAVDFVRKPASIVELQARVDARLARAGGNGSSEVNYKPDLRGNLSLMSVADLLTAAESAQKSAELRVKSGAQTGEIRICRGNIVDGRFAEHTGEKAVYRMAALSDGQFEMSLLPDDMVTGPLNVQPRFALMEAARLLDEGTI